MAGNQLGEQYFHTFEVNMENAMKFKIDYTNRHKVQSSKAIYVGPGKST